MTDFPGARILVRKGSDWEFERNRRGALRWYPLHLALNATGLSSAGSAAIGNPPNLELQSGNVPAGIQDRGREMMEKQIVGYQMHSGIDGLDFWGRPHVLQVFVTLGIHSQTNPGGRVYTALYMQPPGVTPWPDPSPVNLPFVILRYACNDAGSGEDERFELLTSPGDGVTNTKITRLSGVDPPRSPTSPGGQRTQRYGLIYKPGEYVQALINGKVGATHTDTLPGTGILPANGANLCGVGVYVEQGAINNRNNAAFYSMMLETYRP